MSLRKVGKGAVGVNAWEEIRCIAVCRADVYNTPEEIDRLLAALAELQTWASTAGTTRVADARRWAIAASRWP
jgi:hypothetical protein